MRIDQRFRVTACRLAPVKSRVKIHYVPNIDPAHLHDVLALCKGRQTRFIIASKTFTTSETLANLEMSRAFLATHDVAADQAMGAVTADPAAAKLCGFSPVLTLELGWAICALCDRA